MRPARSTRSTARASPTRTKPGEWWRKRSSEALLTGDGLALARYPERLEEIYGLYFKVARIFVKLIGNPAVMRELTRVGMHSRTAHGVGAAHHGQSAPTRTRSVRPRRRTPRSSVLVRALPDPSGPTGLGLEYGPQVDPIALGDGGDGAAAVARCPRSVG